MIFTRYYIPEIILIKPKVLEDSRGSFMESFRQDLFDRHIGPIRFLQENESRSTSGVLRGLHYQVPPKAQSKLIRVVAGRILDVAVDIRKSSSTFGQHIAVELSADDNHQLFIPKGFAHGFIVLSREAIFSYKVDAYYAPEHERGIFYADPELGIDWGLPEQEMVLSSKDQELPCLNEAEIFE